MHLLTLLNPVQIIYSQYLKRVNPDHKTLKTLQRLRIRDPVKVYPNRNKRAHCVTKGDLFTR